MCYNGYNYKRFQYEKSEIVFLLKHIDRETIKMSNGKKILQLLYNTEEDLTKQDIAKKLNISLPTVTHNLNSLMEEGYVLEAGVADSTGGRKPLVVRFDATAKYTLGVDIQSERIILLLTDLRSKEIDKVVMPLKHHVIDHVMNDIHEELETLLAKHGLKKSQLLGIGFSLHGTVNNNKLIFEISPNANYKNIDFHHYEELFDAPIYIDNEANVSAIAESVLGRAKQKRNVVYMSINQGVGTGIIVSGYLYKGKNNRAGEFGHMVIDVNGPLCSCGNSGCLETFVSTKALMKRYEALTGKECGLDDIYEAFKKGEKDAEQTIDEYCKYLAVGIRNILFTLDPHYIIIGGIMSKYGDMIHEKLLTYVYDQNYFYNKKDNKILMSRLNGNAAVYGASILPLMQLLNGNQKII